MKTNELFTNLMESIEESVVDFTFNVWFKNLELIEITDNTIKIKVPLEVHKNFINEMFGDLVKEKLASLTDKEYKIIYLTEHELEEETKNNNNIINSALEEMNKKTTISENNETWQTNLNPELNFDNYIVGESNRLAYISAINVAQSPGTLKNPLFIYGRSGVGKTHLMQAVGNYIAKNTNKKVLYTTSSEFRDEYVDLSKMEKGSYAIEKANKFKDKYRNVDVLIIDDIQFLVGNEYTQQEFFYTFEALHKANKQIIISSDKSPDDLKKIEERLRSRFTWGLPVDIYPPDFELRCEIIKQIISRTSIKEKITKDVVEYIANACPNDVRQIEGTINRLLAYTAMMTPDIIDLDFAIEALKDYVTSNPYQENSIERIQKVVADYFKITVDDLKSKKRNYAIAMPRHIAIYLCRIETDERLEKIGLEFGGRDHSTVVASCDKIKNDIKEDENLENLLKEIKSKL